MNPQITHPVQLLYESMTSYLTELLPEPASKSSAPCSYCKQPASEFKNHFEFRDGYKRDHLLCEACMSLTPGSIELMGVESYRGKRKVPVPQKFGMWPGVSAVIEVESGKATLLPPQGVYDKLPQKFLDTFETIPMPMAQRISWALKNATFPILYIAEFGKTKDALINNLQVSLSPAALTCCSDKEKYTFNAQVAVQIIDSLSDCPPKELNLFHKTISGLASGKVTPLAAANVWKEHSELHSAAIKLPADPHERMDILRLISAVRKERLAQQKNTAKEANS